MDSSDGECSTVDEQLKFKNNAAWADAIAKVLCQNKPSGKRVIVLSKAKKINDTKERKSELSFEIVGEKETADSEVEIEIQKPRIGKKLLMKEYQTKGRVKPSVLEKNKERTLMKIATKGVVQLFNAVRQRQNEIDKTVKKAGKSRIKREKMLHVIDKKKFLDALTGSIKSTSIDVIGDIQNDEHDNAWKVLNDNFMMNAKLKDWDKEEQIDEYNISP